MALLRRMHSLLVIILGCTGAPPPGSIGPPAPAPAPAPAPVEDTGVADPIADWPALLSETGLYADITEQSLAAGVVPYTVAWPLWSDGAEKDRFLWLPPDTTIDVSDPDYWQVPVGTKAWKHFTRDGVLVETRYIARLTFDDWLRVSYQWRPDGTDADVVPDGVENASGTPHDIPNTQACDHCHRGDGLLGVNAIQLGADNPDGMLEALTAQGWLAEPFSHQTRVPGTGLTRETLGYLHGNCGGCHADGYPLAHNYPLRLRVLVDTQTPEETLLYTTAINTPTNHETSATSVAVVPGDPGASQVYERMERRDGYAMPPTGTEIADPTGLSLVHDWILSLEDTP